MDLIQQAEQRIRQLLLVAAQAAGYSVESQDIVLEIPQHSQNGDYSSNLAFAIAQRTRQAPQEVAARIAAKLTFPTELVARIWHTDTGFINFTLKPDWFFPVVRQVQERGCLYDRTYCGKLNPTVALVIGKPPLSASQLRAAAVAAALVNTQRALGAETEFYLVSLQAASTAAAFENLGIAFDRVANLAQLSVYDDCWLGHSRGVLVGASRDISQLASRIQCRHKLKELKIQPVTVKGASHLELELLQQIGPDALRYYLLRQRPNTKLTLDAPLATTEHGSNPFYRTLYLAVRLRQIAEHGNCVKSYKDHDSRQQARLYYILAQVPAVVKQAVHYLQPSKITGYIEELSEFLCTIRVMQRINYSQEETALFNAAYQVLHCMLRLLGCEVPERI